MDTVINRLSDIEKAAVSVMDGASERKKQMAREMEEKTAAFDAQLEKENQDRISEILEKPYFCFFICLLDRERFNIMPFLLFS